MCKYCHYWWHSLSHSFLLYATSIDYLNQKKYEWWRIMQALLPFDCWCFWNTEERKHLFYIAISYDHISTNIAVANWIQWCWWKHCNEQPYGTWIHSMHYFNNLGLDFTVLRCTHAHQLPGHDYIFLLTFALINNWKICRREMWLKFFSYLYNIQQTILTDIIKDTKWENLFNSSLIIS